jgi:hypothetical protein
MQLHEMVKDSTRDFSEIISILTARNKGTVGKYIFMNTVQTVARNGYINTNQLSIRFSFMEITS